MSSITEQISATSKSQLESQLNFLNSVLKNTVDVAGQVVALNLSTVRNAAERSAIAARQLIEAKDPRAVLDLARPLSAIEGLFAYNRELFSIASQTQQALFRTASERLRDVPAKALVLAAPVVTQVSESAVNAAVAATNAAAEATQAAAEGAAGTASQAAHAASDAAQAATSSAVEAARATSGSLAGAARETTEEIDDAANAAGKVQDAAVEATARAARDATEAGAGAANDAAEAIGASTANAVEAAGDTVARAAEAAPAPKDAVAAAVERVTGAAAETAQAPAPVTASSAPLFETEPSQKGGRGRAASKPAAEPVAALADKPAQAKSAPGRSRK